MTANAVAAAAAPVREKALGLAAELLQADSTALEIIDGEVVHRDRASGPSISLAALAHHLRPTSSTRGRRDPGLCADGWFDTSHQTYPYGNQIAVVSVDRETGAVTVEQYLIAYDIGRAINPMLVRGQILGGLAQGIGGALFEEFLYNEQGEPLCVTLADYLIPTLKEVPLVDVLLTEDAPTNRNPLGIKGAGESGIAAVGAAIASAVEDAIGMPGTITSIPITPQRLKRILDSGGPVRSVGMNLFWPAHWRQNGIANIRHSAEQKQEVNYGWN
jgi:carbon-monoxide dehydrogenase large subunit/6-hydroxypseudooxynicotine dehydrogenase subunit gamma